MKGLRLLVISTVFPGRDSGSALALRSSLLLYQQCFEHCHYVATLQANLKDLAKSEFPAVRFTGLDFKRETLPIRFLRSLICRRPASVMQYLGTTQFIMVRKLLAEHRNQGGTHVLFEHLTPAVLLQVVADEFAGMRIAFRSHDVLAHAFSLLAANQDGFRRLAWRWEATRVRQLEGEIVRKVDHVWTITDTDALDYQNLYGRTPDGVIGVDIDIARMARCAKGMPLKVMHLGGSDARKAQGLNWLVDEVWPHVRQHVPQAELHLGGLGSEPYARPTLAVYAHGCVEDDVAFMGEGVVFVNPQQAGSGIKLKSLTAMAANRLLVTTSNGSRGIPGRPGFHFFQGDDTQTMVRNLVMSLSQSPENDAIRRNGIQLVREHYSQDKLEARALPLVKSYAGISTIR